MINRLYCIIKKVCPQAVEFPTARGHLFINYQRFYMIKCFFGVPGVGKNTILTMIAQKELARMKKGKSKYKHIYSDFYIDGAEKFDYSFFKDYKMYDSLILIEEMGLDADNRKYRSFTDEERNFFVLHRHLFNDIYYATQDYSNVDAKIRGLTEELWYLTRSCVPVLRHLTVARRIFRQIEINEHTSELIMGYRFSNFLEKLFVSNSITCIRPLYYGKFESFDEGPLSKREILQSEPWNPRPADHLLARILCAYCNLRAKICYKLYLKNQQKQSKRKVLKGE